MDLSPVIIAIPMYFTLMGIELVYEAVTRKKTYRLNDAITNISTGVLQQLTGTFMKIVTIGIYVLVFETLAVWQLGANWWTFALVFILYDLCYYWSHRLAHEISLFWGGHVVHHQSEDFNLSVALRQSSTSFIWSTPFYLPLAVLGFDPVQFVLVGGLNLLYQFWIHTEHINRMPRWFEAVFNTPSHHRVHHGRDPKYIDRNYAGVFIIWDRMFGTFKAEEERPHYGITRPLNSWNPVYANFAHYIDLFKTARRAHNVRDALGILFRPPGWAPEYLGGPQYPKEVNDGYHKYDRHPNSVWMNLYILTQFLVALGINAFYFFGNDSFDWLTKTLFAVWIVVTTLMFGFLFESRKRWLMALEVIRLLSAPLGVYGLSLAGFTAPGWLLLLAAGYALLSLAAFRWITIRNAVFAVEREARVEPVGLEE